MHSSHSIDPHYTEGVHVCVFVEKEINQTFTLLLPVQLSVSVTRAVTLMVTRKYELMCLSTWNKDNLLMLSVMVALCQYLCASHAKRRG